MYINLIKLIQQRILLSFILWNSAHRNNVSWDANHIKDGHNDRVSLSKHVP